MGTEVARAFKELQVGAQHIEGSLKQNFKFHQDLRIVNWPPHNDVGLCQIQSRIDTWVKRDAVEEIIEGSLNHSPLSQQVSGGPFQLLKQYPVICGI